MITKYKQYNESIRSLLVGPTEEELWNNIKDYEPHKILIKSLKAGYIKGVKYALKYNVDMRIYGLESFKKLLKILFDNNEKELLIKCIEDYYKNNTSEIYYYLFSCMYGYLKGVQDCIITHHMNIVTNYFVGLELAVKYNQLNIVDFLVSHFEYTASAYDWESKTKEFAEKYNNREVLDYFLRQNESIRNLLVGPTKEEVWENLGFDKPFNTPEEYFTYIFDHLVFSEKSLFYKKWKDEDGMVVIDYYQYDKKIYCYLSDYTKIMEKIFNLSYSKVTSVIKKILKEKLKLDDNVNITYLVGINDDYDDD